MIKRIQRTTRAGLQIDCPPAFNSLGTMSIAESILSHAEGLHPSYQIKSRPFAFAQGDSRIDLLSSTCA